MLHLQVITKQDSEGHRLEPFEEALVEVPEEFVGPVVDLLGSRKGQMVDMNSSESGLTRVTYVMPTRYATFSKEAMRNLRPDSTVHFQLLLGASVPWLIICVLHFIIVRSHYECEWTSVESALACQIDNFLHVELTTACNL